MPDRFFTVRKATLDPGVHFLTAQRSRMWKISFKEDFVRANLINQAAWSDLFKPVAGIDVVGSGDMTEGLLKNRVAAYSQAAALTALAVNILFQNGIQVSDLIMSGVLAHYPSIKLVSVESGIGWIPFMLEMIGVARSLLRILTLFK
jgi:hypothetical protein